MDDGAIDPMTEEEEPKDSEEPTTASVEPIPFFDFSSFENLPPAIEFQENRTGKGDIMTETIKQQKAREIKEAKEVARIEALDKAFKEKQRKEAEEA